MSQRMFNLSKWRRLAEGESIAFNDPRQRMVSLEVNSPGEVCYYVLQDVEDLVSDPERSDDEAAGRAVLPLTAKAGKAITFLGLAKGRDRLEFGVEGNFELTVEGGSAMIYTTDSMDVSTHIVAPVIFTKIANRRARNPQLELLQYTMRRNQEMFREQLEAESARRLEAMERKLESYAPERYKGTPLERDRAKQPAQAGVGDPSAAPVGETGTDEAEGQGGSPGRKRRKETAGAGDDQGSLV